MSDQILSEIRLPFAGTHGLQTHTAKSYLNLFQLSPMFPERLSSDRSFNPSLLLGDVILICSFLSGASGVTAGLAHLPAVHSPLWAPLHRHQRCLPPPSTLLAHPAATPAEDGAGSPAHPHPAPSPPVLDPPNFTLCFTFQLQTPKPLGRQPAAASSLPTPAWRSPHRLLLGAGLRGCLPRAHTECAVSRACLGAGAGIKSKTPVCTASVFEKGHLAGLAVQAEFAGWF